MDATKITYLSFWDRVKFIFIYLFEILEFGLINTIIIRYGIFRFSDNIIILNDLPNIKFDILFILVTYFGTCLAAVCGILGSVTKCLHRLVLLVTGKLRWYYDEDIGKKFLIDITELPEIQ